MPSDESDIVERLETSAAHSEQCGWSTHALMEREAAARIKQLEAALRTIAELDLDFKGIKRKYQKAVQTARIALGLQLRRNDAKDRS